MTRSQVRKDFTAAVAVTGAASWRVALPVMSLIVLPAVAACGAGRSATTCAGQCAPPYELQVNFTAGTSHATAEKVIASCAKDNPAVVRAGALHYLRNGMSRATIYTRVFAGAKRTSQLQECLRSSGVVATAAWPS